MKNLKHSILMFLILMFFWILFTSLDIQEIIAGLITSLLIVIATIKLEPILYDLQLTPKSLLFSIIYLFVFLAELIKSNIDVAFRVINPKLPIKPGIVKVRTKLKSKIGKTILANSITITPGTMTTEIKGEHLYIHWIEITEDDIDGATHAIVQKFEKYLEVIFG